VTAAFLDIETSWEHTITIIGIYKGGHGTRQLIAPHIDRAALLAEMEGVELLFTYNGTGFDLPVIERLLGVSLKNQMRHRDLMYDCWKHKLKGGLKGVEKTLGIHRDTEGVNGLQAMNLWAAHLNGNEEALELLLRYNKEDCENLEILAQKLGVIDSCHSRESGNPVSSVDPRLCGGDNKRA
jgi:uncharacterized protein YprB with RNaseH-like and TPR domain